jgi:hypothetical protein
VKAIRRPEAGAARSGGPFRNNPITNEARAGIGRASLQERMNEIRQVKEKEYPHAY